MTLATKQKLFGLRGRETRTEVMSGLLDASKKHSLLYRDLLAYFYIRQKGTKGEGPQ